MASINIIKLLHCPLVLSSAVPSMNLGNIILRERRESNTGQLGEKHECYHCAQLPPNKFNDFKSNQNHQLFLFCRILTRLFNLTGFSRSPKSRTIARTCSRWSWRTPPTAASRSRSPPSQAWRTRSGKTTLAGLTKGWLLVGTRPMH